MPSTCTRRVDSSPVSWFPVRSMQSIIGHTRFDPTSLSKGNGNGDACSGMYIKKRELGRAFVCASDGEKHESPLIKLMPCGHEIHLDCLCTNMRIEMAYSGARSYTDCEEDTDDDDTIDSMTEERESAPHLDANVHLASDLTQNCTENDTIGKWLTCSVCRRDAWALLPRRQRPRRSLHRSLHGLVS